MLKIKSLKKLYRYLIRESVLVKVERYQSRVGYDYSVHRQIIFDTLGYIEPEVFEECWSAYHASHFEMLALGASLEEFNTRLSAVLDNLSKPELFKSVRQPLESRQISLDVYLGQTQKGLQNPATVIQQFIVLSDSLVAAIDWKISSDDPERITIVDRCSHYTRYICTTVLMLVYLQYYLEKRYSQKA